ncbi:MAG: matrixin family metalloprotease [Agriterribacter sp.]
MYCRFYFSIAFFILLAACSEKDKPKEVLVINIQPFKSIPVETTMFVLTELNKIFPHTNLLPAIDLPVSAYNADRNRYRADSLINFLNKKTTINHITIGLTNYDISTTKNAIKDWGVIGLGSCPGKACIVSTFRLSKTETKMQLFKITIHELGHTAGLEHCSVKTCFMRDAEGGNPTNEEKEFCPACKQYLKSKGWNLD